MGGHDRTSGFSNKAIVRKSDNSRNIFCKSLLKNDKKRKFMSRLKHLEVLELSGTPCEIAYQLGKQRRRKIEKAVEFWNRHLSHIYRDKKELLKRLEKSFRGEAGRQAPFYLEEIYWMAKGAGVSFPDLFRLNLTELVPYADKCTDLIFSLKTPKGKDILLTHNEDWDPRRNDVFVLKANLNDCTYATLAYNGYLPGLSAGRNSFGLCHSVNYLRPRDLRIGVPRIFITRFLLTARSIEDCLRFIRGKRRAFGQSIHLAEGDQYVNLELTARRMILRHPTLPAVHSNHYLSSALKKYVPRPSPNSLTRQNTAQKLLKERCLKGGSLKPGPARSLAKRILSDRSGHPYAIWREADSEAETSATLATVMVGTDASEMLVFRERPVSSRPIRIRI
jgi:acyl-CoA:6-aminopenicillanic acid acyl transferase